MSLRSRFYSINLCSGSPNTPHDIASSRDIRDKVDHLSNLARWDANATYHSTSQLNSFESWNTQRQYQLSPYNCPIYLGCAIGLANHAIHDCTCDSDSLLIYYREAMRGLTNPDSIYKGFRELILIAYSKEQGALYRGLYKTACS